MWGSVAIKGEIEDGCTTITEKNKKNEGTSLEHKQQEISVTFL